MRKIFKSSKFIRLSIVSILIVLIVQMYSIIIIGVLAPEFQLLANKATSSSNNPESYPGEAQKSDIDDKEDIVEKSSDDQYKATNINAEDKSNETLNDNAIQNKEKVESVDEKKLDTLYSTLAIEDESPDMLGWNLQSQSVSPNEGRTSSLDLQYNGVTIYTNENSLAANWQEVSGNNVRYIRQNIRPDNSEIVLIPGKVISGTGTQQDLINIGGSYENPYTNWGSFGKGNGLYKTRVIAFEDVNNDGRYNLNEPLSNWSEYAYIYFGNPQTLGTPIMTTITKQSNGQVVLDCQSGIDGYTNDRDITINWNSVNNAHHYIYGVKNNPNHHRQISTSFSGRMSKPSNGRNPYFYTVKAANEDESIISDMATCGNLYLDQIAPEITVNSIQNSICSTSTFNLTGTVEDVSSNISVDAISGINNVIVRIAGQTLIASVSQNNWSVAINPNTITPGTYNISIQATDNAGNISETTISDVDININCPLTADDNPEWTADTKYIFTRRADYNGTAPNQYIDMHFQESDSLASIAYYEYQYLRRDIQGNIQGTNIVRMNSSFGGLKGCDPSQANSEICTWRPNMQEDSMWIYRIRAVGTDGSRTNWNNWTNISDNDFEYQDFDYLDYKFGYGIFTSSYGFDYAAGGFAVREEQKPVSLIYSPDNGFVTGNSTETIEYLAADSDTEVKRVALYYAYEGELNYHYYGYSTPDNILYGRFNFNFPNGAGDYCLYTLAEDVADDGILDNGIGNVEEKQAYCNLFITYNPIAPRIEIDDVTINEADLITYNARSNVSDKIPSEYRVEWAIRKSNQSFYVNLSDITGVNTLTLNTSMFKEKLQNYSLFDRYSNFFVDDPINPIMRVRLIDDQGNIVAQDYAKVTINNIMPSVGLVATSNGKTVRAATGEAIPTLKVNAGDTVYFNGYFYDPAGNFDAGDSWQARMNYGGTGFFGQQIIQTGDRTYSVNSISSAKYSNGIYYAYLRICEENNLYGFCSFARIRIEVSGGTTNYTDPQGNILPEGSIGSETQPEGDVLGESDDNEIQISLPQSFYTEKNQEESYSLNVIGNTEDLDGFVCTWDFGEEKDMITTEGLDELEVDYTYSSEGTFDMKVTCETGEGKEEIIAESKVYVGEDAAENQNESEDLAENEAEVNSSLDQDNGDESDDDSEDDSFNVVQFIQNNVLLCCILPIIIVLILGVILFLYDTSRENNREDY